MSNLIKPQLKRFGIWLEKYLGSLNLLVAITLTQILMMQHLMKQKSTTKKDIADTLGFTFQQKFFK